MKETISSGITFLSKVIFPLAWIGGFGYATLMSWLNPSAIINPSSDVGATQVGSLLALILGSLAIYWLCIRLKKVSVDEHSLYVSNYIKEIQIPLAKIESVIEEKWGNIHLVIIDLKTKTEFGYSLRFMPKARLFQLGPHPVIAHLRRKSKKRERKLRR